MTVTPRRRSRWRAPRRLKITASGRVYLLLTLGVGLGALNTGNNLLYLVLGLQLATVVASGVLSERCVGRLSIERLPGDGARAEEPSHLTYRVQAGTAAVLALSLAEDGIEGGATADIPYLAPHRSTVVRAAFSPKRRGPLNLTAVTVTTLYPLGLFAKSRTFDLPELRWVYPRRAPLHVNPSEPNQTPGEVMASNRPGGEGDLLGLRELGASEDARRVHWLKSAAYGSPLVVEREREQERTIELDLPVGGPGAAMDDACEATAATAERYLAEGFQVGLTTREGRLQPGVGVTQSHRILHLLARAGYEDART